MKLYDANAGNAKRVRIFIAEKEIEVPRVVLELGKDTRSPEFLAINSLGEVPVLELDSDQCIAESNAICRYLESAYPENPLMGTSTSERDKIDMWSERVYSHLFLTIGLMVRHKLPMFEHIVDQVPAFAEAQRKAVPDKWRWLDSELSDGRPYIAGETFTFADVQGVTAFTLAEIFELGVPDDCEFAGRWAESVRQRKSWSA